MAGGTIAHLLDATVDGRKLDNWEIEAFIWPMIGNVDHRIHHDQIAGIIDVTAHADGTNPYYEPAHS